MVYSFLTPAIAFAAVAFFLGNLGDGLNIFQGIYLVNIGWNEGAVGTALSLMGLTMLICQTFAGDIIDKTSFDRRKLLAGAAVATGCSAMAIMLVREGNQDHMIMFVTKVLEGISSSFVIPCLAALTLANFGPDQFDSAMANNILWGHVGSAVSAILAGTSAYILYPNIKFCFIVIGLSALSAAIMVKFLPEGDPLLGRGMSNTTKKDNERSQLQQSDANFTQEGNLPEAESYISVICEPKTLTLCLTGFMYHLSNANILLVLGELMSQDGNNNGDDDNGDVNRAAIPLIGGGILIAQAFMALTTKIGDYYTERGVGRKVLFLVALIALPIRCMLIIYWSDAGNTFLLLTQILDGISGGFFSLLHPLLVADITFGSGRFNLIMGLSASCFGLGGTTSNYFGQLAVERLGHVESLTISLFISFIPIVIFAVFMPETLNTRDKKETIVDASNATPYVLA